MTQALDQQRERSNTLMLRLLIGIARLLGRSVARVLLLPITAYFLLTGGAAKRAGQGGKVPEIAALGYNASASLRGPCAESSSAR